METLTTAWLFLVTDVIVGSAMGRQPVPLPVDLLWSAAIWKARTKVCSAP